MSQSIYSFLPISIHYHHLSCTFPTSYNSCS